MHVKRWRIRCWFKLSDNICYYIVYVEMNGIPRSPHILPNDNMWATCRSWNWLILNIFRPRQDGHHFADDIIQFHFFEWKWLYFIQISLEYVPKGPIDNKLALMQIMAWRRIIIWTSDIQCRCHFYPWGRHQMETFSALLALCAGNSPVTGEFPSERPETRSFDVSLICALNKRWSKQTVRLVIWDSMALIMTSL